MNFKKTLIFIIALIICFNVISGSIETKAAAAVPKLQLLTQPLKYYYSDDVVSFTVSCPNYTGKVQYRVSAYNTTTKKTTEFFNNSKANFYSTIQYSGTDKYAVSFPTRSLDPGSYYITVYTRRAGTKVTSDSSAATASFLIKTTDMDVSMNGSYKMYTSSSNIYPDKIWKITFDKPVNPQSINASNIKISGSNGESMGISLQNDIQNNILYVIPITKYTKGITYTLTIANIVDKSGNKLKNQIKIPFKANENMYIDTITVNSYNEFYNLVLSAVKNNRGFLDVTVNNYSKELQLYKNFNFYKMVHDVMNNYDLEATIAQNTFTDYSKSRYKFYFESENTLANYEELFYTQAKLKSYILDMKVKEIVKNIIKKDMTEYDKVKAIHDYMLDNCTYDKKLFSDVLEDVFQESYDAFGALLYNVAVCQGYAFAMDKLLKEAGVESIIVYGTAAKQGHAWNIVKVSNKYYHLDATWDDSTGASSKYEYFLRSDSFMAKDHQWGASAYPKCPSDYSKS